MSNIEKEEEVFEGYKRCGVCDYCELNHIDYTHPSAHSPGKGVNLETMKGYTAPKRKFFYDKTKTQYVCEVCHGSHNDSMREFNIMDEDKYDKDMDDFLLKLEAIRNNERTPDYKWTTPSTQKGPPKKVTLAKVVGVNEGPQVDNKTLEIKKNK